MIATPSPTLLWMLAPSSASLVAGSVVRFVGLRKADDELRRKRFASLRTWWIIALVVGGCLLAGRAGRLRAPRGGHMRRPSANTPPSSACGTTSAPPSYAAYVITVIQYLLILFDQASAFLVFVPLACLAILAVCNWSREDRRDTSARTGALFWGVMVLIYGISHAAYLFILPASSGGPAGPAGWFLFLLILTEADDIFQAIIGRAFGAHKRHRIAPIISPNKTWEGLIGGMLVTIALAIFLAPWLTTLRRDRTSRCCRRRCSGGSGPRWRES